MNIDTRNWLPKITGLCCAIALWPFLTPCQADAPPSAGARSFDTAPMADAGVDVGVAKTVTTLFLRPNNHPTHIAVLQPGDRAILVSRVPVSGWLNVIQSSSGHQGWVRARDLTIHLTHQEQPKVHLESAPAGADNLPVLSVTNSTGLPLYFHLSQLDEIKIDPHQTHDITVPAGVHSFNAAIANTVPLFGYNEFPNGMKYSWNFVLTTGPQHPQTQSVSPELQGRIQTLQDAVNALQADVKAMEGKIDADKAAVAQQQAQLKTDTDALGAKKAALDPSNAAAVTDINTQTEHKNAEAVAAKQAEDALNAEIDKYNAKLADLKQKRQELKDIASSINKQP